MERDDHPYGAVLKKILERKGWNQKTFSAKTGISENSISAISLGKTNPGKLIRSRLSEVTGVPDTVMNFLIFGETVDKDSLSKRQRIRHRILWPIVFDTILRIYT